MRWKTAVNLDYVNLVLIKANGPLHLIFQLCWFYTLRCFASGFYIYSTATSQTNCSGLQLNVSESVVNEILKHWTCILDENITTKDNWIVMQNTDIIINL